MFFPSSIWITGAGVFLLGLTGRFLYERYLHPAWRKERLVKRACEKAFEEETYVLVRLRADPGRPSIRDLFPRPLGLPEVPRYFTYYVETVEEDEPDFSGMSRREIRLVRRYLHRNLRQVTHYGRKVLHPEWKEEPFPRARQKNGGKRMRNESSRVTA